MNWQTAMEIYLMTLEHGTDESKEAAREDLRRLAKEVDKANEAS